MAHEHKAPGPCIWCSIKHLGAAKVRIGEALASSDPERRRVRLLDATFEMNEAEATHLSEYPEYAQIVRALRKRVEEAAFGYSQEDQADVLPRLNAVIEELSRIQAEEGKSMLAGAHKEGSMPTMTANEPSITPETVLGAIRHYETTYKAPASISDIQFLLTIPEGSPTDKDIDKHLALAPPERVQAAVDELFSEGRIKTTEFGGYANPDYIEKGFNILKPRNRLKMALSTNDVGLVVGSSFAAKGLEKVVDFADQQLGYSTQPPHARLATWVPPILGAALIYYGWKSRGSTNKSTAAVVAGSHLLAQTVDTAETLATTGGAGFSVKSYRSYQPAAPTPPQVSGRPLF